MYTPDDPGSVILKDLGRALHRHSINCKLSGGIALSTGIKNNVTLIHGPKGCAFQQRIPVLRDMDGRWVVCSNLDENDIIYGGHRKLAETIIKADKTYQPEMITILLTCATGIIGDDVQGVIEEVRRKVKARIIWADTSGFSHRDLKDFDEKFLKDQTKCYKHPRSQSITSIEGCGQGELFRAIVEQLMEDPEKYGGINERSAFYIMPVRWFGKWWKDYFKEIREIFGESEIKVNSLAFDRSSIEEIKRLPCHRLNLKGYGRWVKNMKEKFGTEYIPDCVEYYNSPFRDGIKDFYMDAARLLGAEKEVEKAVTKKLAYMDEKLNPFREIFKNKRLAVLRGWTYTWGTPYLVLSQILNLGFKLVYLELEYDHIYDWNINKDTIEEHLNTVRGIYESYGVKADMRVEATIEEEIAALRYYKPDLVITGFERKWIPHSMGIPAYVPYIYSFYQGITGAMLAAEGLYHEFNRGIIRRTPPIYTQNNTPDYYDQRRYPIPCDLLPSVRLWEEVRYVE